MKLTQQQLQAYVQDPVQLIAQQLALGNGKTYGECWAPFQEEAFRAIFARHENGRPVHRLALLERRRGESKTCDLSAVALADLLTGPDHHRSFAVAADEDQAGLIQESIEDFCARSPVLADVKVQSNLITNTATGSSLRILAADVRTNFGLRPRLCLFDELTQQRDRRLWTVMWTAIAKSPLSQMIVASMAGTDFSSVAWEVRQLAASKSQYYFQGRAGTEPAPWLDLEDLEEQRASLHPIDFQVFFEAEWSEPGGAWVTREQWEKCETGAEVSGLPYPLTSVIFVDLGLRKDATVVSVCHGTAGSDGQLVAHVDTLRTMRGTRGEPVQLEDVEDLVVELCEAYRVRRVVFESWQGAASVQRLRKRLEGIFVEEYFPTAQSMATMWGNLYSLITNGRLVAYPHDQLRREMLALVVRSQAGRLKVVEGSTLIHQDHAVALAGACQLITLQAFLSPESARAAKEVLEELSTSGGSRSRFADMVGVPGVPSWPMDRW